MSASISAAYGKLKSTSLGQAIAKYLFIFNYLIVQNSKIVLRWREVRDSSQSFSSDSLQGMS